MTDEVLAAAPEEAPEAAPLTPTPASEWPEKAPGIVVELPSGGIARLRRPPWQLYVSYGRVPPKVRKRLDETDATTIDGILKAFTADERKLFVDWIISCAFVEPEVSMTRKDGSTYIGDIDEADKDEVLMLLGVSFAG